jgi:hypothetical protein
MIQLHLRWDGHIGIFGLRLASSAGTRLPWINKLTFLGCQGPRK